jgi:hypothetical protein
MIVSIAESSEFVARLCILRRSTTHHPATPFSAPRRGDARQSADIGTSAELQIPCAMSALVIRSNVARKWDSKLEAVCSQFSAAGHVAVLPPDGSASCNRRRSADRRTP